MLFVLDAAFGQSTVAIERRRASYTAEIRIDASVNSGVLTETYTVRCAAETTRVDRLLVRFSEARESPLEWSLAGGNSGQFSARRLSPGEQEQVGLPEGGEAWELNLQLVRAGDFELRAVRSTQIAGEMAVGLASVAEAQIQRGTLTIRALASAELTIKNERLVAIPAELLEGDRVQSTRGTFRYHPGRDDLGAEPAVSIAAAATKQPAPDAWVWNCRLASRYAVAGISAHFATLDIQTAGKQQLRVTLPADTRLQAAWVDTERLPLVLSASGKPGFVVDLPPGRALATLSIYYTGTGGLPTLAASRQPEYPTVDVPVLSRQWSICLPPGYEVLESASQFPIVGLRSPSVAQRLFGVLARGNTTARFNPLMARDWEQLVVRDSQSQAAGETGSAFLAALGSTMSEHFAGEAESALDWAQLLTVATQIQMQSGRAVLVDVDGLARLGLRPHTLVQFQSGDTAGQRGVALLRSVQLTVLATANTVVLCNATTAATAARELSRASQQGVFAVEPGVLADELAGALAGTGPRFYPVTHWRQTPDLGPYPWEAAAPGNPTVDDLGAWNVYAMILSPAAAPAVRIVHSGAMAALAWIVFLTAVAAGCCFRADRRSGCWPRAVWRQLSHCWRRPVLRRCRAPSSLPRWSV